MSASYSVSQKSGGSHEDDEPPRYSLSMSLNGELDLTLLRDADYQEAVDVAHRHAKFHGITEYLLNGKPCKE